MVRIYHLEGVIGAGKSTLLQRINQYPDVMIIQEPVDQWAELLGLFYSDPARYAFAFQVQVLKTRVQAIREGIRGCSDSITTILVERWPSTDKELFAQPLYEQGLISSEDWVKYQEIYNQVILDLPKAQAIYLQVPVSIASSRIIQRNRPGESVSLSYLNALHQRHEEWAKHSPQVIRISGESYLLDKVAEILELIS
jgi:deoxyadenosine/deoxycytidine kinase